MDFDPGKALRAVYLDEFGKIVDFLAAQCAALGHAQSLDQRSGGKELEAGTCNAGGNVPESEVKARVGLVHSVVAHGLFPCQAGKGQRQINIHGVMEHAGHETFGHAHDLIFIHKAHFDVDLGELGLAVGAQVLVTEAAGHLVIAIHAAHHEHLLELLGRLRQGIELALIEAAGHKEVARSFRRGLGQNAVAQAQVIGHARTAQVKVTPGQAQVFTRVAAVFHGKGRSFGGVQQLPVQHHHFDFSGGQIGVAHAFGAGAHPASDRQYIFTAQHMSVAMRFRGDFRAEHHLGKSVAIPQIHENQSSMVAAVLHPAHEADFAAVIGQTEGAAIVAALPVAKGLYIAGVFLLDVCLRFLIVHHLIAVAHVLLSLGEVRKRESYALSAPAASARDTARCSPFSMFLTATVPAASSSGPRIRAKRARDLSA